MDPPPKKNYGKENWHPGLTTPMFWEVPPTAPPPKLKNLHSIQGQHTRVTHTVSIRQWMMTPKANSHNINICGKWKYFINNSNWPSPVWLARFCCRRHSGVNCGILVQSLHGQLINHAIQAGCLSYSSCRNESWLGLKLARQLTVCFLGWTRKCVLNMTVKTYCYWMLGSQSHNDLVHDTKFPEIRLKIIL